MRRLDELESLIDQVSDMVEKAGKTTNTVCGVLCYLSCCCRCLCCRSMTRGEQRKRCFINHELFRPSNEILFGDLIQSRLIMEKNFEGRQFSIRAAGKPNIDCMFFPSTQGDEVVLDPLHDPSMSSMGILKELESVSNPIMEVHPKRKYLNKSTIIMCNPNALVYQQMITQANAYWLDFFLKRDCNVLVWNYRGYGESE